MTKLSEVMACINAIESECDVASWQVNGLRIWPIVRIRLSMLIRDHDYIGPTIARRTTRGLLSLLGGLLRSFCSLLRLLVSLTTRPRFSIVVLTKPSNTPGELNVYSGPLQETLLNHGLHHVAIEVGAQSWRRARTEEPVLYLDKFWLGKMIGILYHLLSLSAGRSFKLPGHRRAGQLLSERFPLVGCKLLSKPSLLREARLIQAHQLLFSFLLGLIRPRKTLIISYYNRLAMGFILAAREHRALAADYQHGVQGRFHYAYGSWLSIPATGYDLLPDIFLNWSELDKTYIDQWASSTPHKSIVVGNLLTAHVENDAAGFLRKYASFLNTVETKPLILFTLQNFVPPDWIWDAVLETSDEMKWLIRLHPLYKNFRKVVTENLAKRKVSGFDIDEATILPLPILLRKIAVHVTGCSSVVLDALHSGKRSIIIDHYGQEYYSDLIESGIVAAAFNPQELRQALCSLLSRPPLHRIANPTSRLLDFLDSDTPPGRRKQSVLNQAAQRCKDRENT